MIPVGFQAPTLKGIAMDTAILVTVRILEIGLLLLAVRVFFWVVGLLDSLLILQRQQRNRRACIRAGCDRAGRHCEGCNLYDLDEPTTDLP